MKLLTVLTSASVVALSVMGSPLYAQEQAYYVSANASMFSHSLWRGIDLNKGNPVLQGGADLEYDSGFYAGVFASMYEFDEGNSSDNGTEIDLYAGYTMAASESFDIEFAVTNYQFTGETQSTTEFKIGVTYDIATINLHRDIDLKSTYFELNLTRSLTESFSVNTHIGLNDDGQDYFYDYSISGEYAATDTFSLILGYSNHELSSEITGSKVFAGASILF